MNEFVTEEEIQSLMRRVSYVIDKLREYEPIPSAAQRLLIDSYEKWVQDPFNTHHFTMLSLYLYIVDNVYTGKLNLRLN